MEIQGKEMEVRARGIVLKSIEVEHLLAEMRILPSGATYTRKLLGNLLGLTEVMAKPVVVPNSPQRQKRKFKHYKKNGEANIFEALRSGTVGNNELYAKSGIASYKKYRLLMKELVKTGKVILTQSSERGKALFFSLPGATPTQGSKVLAYKGVGEGAVRKSILECLGKKLTATKTELYNASHTGYEAFENVLERMIGEGTIKELDATSGRKFCLPNTPLPKLPQEILDEEKKLSKNYYGQAKGYFGVH